MERKVIIKNPTGLHARPVATLVKEVSVFPCTVTLIKGDKKANAKSIMNVLALGLSHGSEVTVTAEGDRAEEALKTVGDFIEKIFD